MSVISEQTWRSLNSPNLLPAEQKLCGPDWKALNVLGELSLTLSYKNRSSVQSIFVIKDLYNNLLGLPAIKALQLLAQVNIIAQSIANQHPSLFTGLGSVRHSYEIKIQPGAHHLHCSQL